MRKRIALPQPAFGGDVFIPAGEGHRLEGDESDLLRVVHREADDGSDLIVIHSIHKCHHQNDLNAGFVKIIDRAQLHIEKVPDLAMAIGVVSDAVKLQVDEAQAGFSGPPAKLLAFRKLDTVRCGLHAGIPDFSGIRDRVQEIGRERRFAAGKLNRHLPPRLDLDGVIHDLHDLFPGQLVDIAHLVRIHEAGIAHHVAAVRQIDRQDRAAAVPDRTAAVIVKIFIGVCRNVATRKILLDPF